MKPIYINVCSPPHTILLGHQGEQLAQQIVFDCCGLANIYGNGIAQLVHKPAQGIPYPVDIKQEGYHVYWNITAADTAMIGIGKVQLYWYVGKKLVKSFVFQTSVTPSVCSFDTSVPGIQDWLNTMTRLGANTEIYAAKAAEYAGLAEQLAARNGYMQFCINDEGHLVQKKTDNVTVSFELKNGRLMLIYA